MGCLLLWLEITEVNSGANMVSIATIHILDALCYALSEFKSLNATTAITIPEIQFVEADGKKGKPLPRKFADSISVQGVLENGATATTAITCTTDGTPDRFEWIISGEKGSLKLEGPSLLVQYGAPTLYQYESSGEKKWEKIEVQEGTFGGIGEVYAAFAKGNKDVVDFDVAVKRHRMVEAIYRSAQNGTRESY